MLCHSSILGLIAQGVVIPGAIFVQITCDLVNKNEQPGIQEQQHVPWPLDPGTLHFPVQSLRDWGKWAAGMTSTYNPNIEL